MKRSWINNISNWDQKGLLSIMGPTGFGKSKLAQEIYSQNPKTLLISVDSISVFKELSIGSAKPSMADINKFNWHGVNLVNIEKEFNAADFVNYCVPLINSALNNNYPVVCCGGSHFYEKALIDGMGPGKKSCSAFQSSLDNISTSVLFEKLLGFDSRFAKKISENDRFRICRYLDLIENQKITYQEIFSPLKSQLNLSFINCYSVGMTEEDYQKQNNILLNRIKSMINKGWIEEVQKLLTKGVSSSIPGLKSVGYREIVAFLDGKINQEDLANQILISHRQLAKKQRTWIRGLQS